MKKKNRIVFCLVAGLVLLSISAVAAFGSANGYGAFKSAVITLATQEENFTAKGSMSVTVDDIALTEMKVDYTQDGTNRSTCTTTLDDDGEYVYYETILNGVETYFSSDDTVYFQTRNDRSDRNLLGIDQNDPTAVRLVNFFSVAVDTVVGDLKNNVVKVGSQDGKDLYQATVSGSQVPALVNAGLSLLASTAVENTGGQVIFEDLDKAAVAAYEKATGKQASQETMAYISGPMEENKAETIYEANQAEIDAIWGYQAELWQKYDDILFNEKNGQGVLYVKLDGSYEYYANRGEYLMAHADGSNETLEYLVAQEVTLEEVDCTFALDSKGRVADGTFTAIFLTKDAAGDRHTVKATLTADVSGYGTTVVRLPDVGDRQKDSGDIS
ncbi:MAG: hypothetical protein HUJ67_00505 [Ruminiclostridium sp.]|nr:hypothetical protein [Ruminiclostridium sp.]